MYQGKLLIGATVLTAAVAGLANAGPDRGSGDGAAPPMQASASGERVTARFSEADANGDGQLDVDEIQALLMRIRAERSVQWLDRDGDGAVSQAEFTGPAGGPGVGMERDTDNRRRYDDEGYEDEDEDEEDDDGATAGPAPAGTTAPPDNGLFTPGSTPKVNTK
ncbi:MULTISPECIES: hypothetical protein [unclassified Halomonas]|uniref:hypothetical protein n=1 Tax=unclassified Halomonas TaxID=2609666 RepID=UPI002468740C|nr:MULTISPECIES: hypothetical protein [unclassified Halomonas]